MSFLRRNIITFFTLSIEYQWTTDFFIFFSDLYSRGVQTGVATATQGQATMFTTTDSMGSTAEAKLLSYLDASPSTSKVNLYRLNIEQ